MGPGAGMVSHGSGLLGHGAGVMGYGLGRQDDWGTKLVGPGAGKALCSFSVSLLV